MNHTRRCLHFWRRRKRVYSWTRRRTILACRACRKEWSR